MKEMIDVLQELEALREENHELKVDNDFLQRQNKALKLRCGKYCLQVRDLETENADLKFRQNFLGVTMTPEEVAIEAAENRHDYYNGDDF